MRLDISAIRYKFLDSSKTHVGLLLTCGDSSRTLFYSCWLVLDSCWLHVIVLTRVGLVLTRVDSCFTRVDSCWFVSDSCWLVSDLCWLALIRVGLVLTRVDLCWYLCIRIDLISLHIPINKISKDVLQKQSSRRHL